MAGPPTEYVLGGGKAGYDRLLKLSRVRWPDTLAFLQRAGVSSGMRCVDVGCGAGTVSLELARLVAPGGSVVGLDMDPVELDLAAQEAKGQAIANVAFRTTRVEAWEEHATYDLAYSRFLLQHLRDPVGLLRRMWDSLRPGGILAVEDVDWDGWGSEPVSTGIEFLVRRYSATLRRRGADPRIGSALYRHLRDLGASEVGVTLVTELRRDPESRALPAGTLAASKTAIVSEGIARPEEVDAAVDELRALGSDPGALVWGPRIFQVCGRKKPS